MLTSIPTPFDILEPPPGPLIPSTLAWVSLAGFMVVALATLWLLMRRHRPASMQRRIAALVDDMIRLSSRTDTIEGLQRVNRLAQRILSAYVPFDPSALSPADLRASASALATSNALSDQSSAEILLRVACIDELTYAPSVEPGEIKETVNQLVEAVSNHVRRHRPS